MGNLEPATLRFYRLIVLALLFFVTPLPFFLPPLPVWGTTGTLTITTDTTLTEDHVGNIDIVADDVTLDCAGHTVTGSLTGDGILLDRRTGVTVKNCQVTNFSQGFVIQFSNRNTLTGNTFNGNARGFISNRSGFNTFEENTANDNGAHGFLILDSSRNTLTGNTANDNGADGFLLISSSGNTLEENSATGNAFGFHLIRSLGNTIFHNNIIDNTVQASADNAANDWHEPVLLEGNFWSDYPGVDDGSGIGKHAIAGDGIGDTDVPWPSPNFDNYPFVRKFVKAANLLATTNRGELVEIDLSAGTAVLLGRATVPSGRDPSFWGWTDLAFEPGPEGDLFAVSRFRGELGSASHLYRIDPASGEILQEIGSTGVLFISDIDFDDDGTLYGNRFVSSPDGGLIFINPSDASVGVPANLRFGQGLVNGGFAVHPVTGELWGIETRFSPMPRIFKIDPNTGLASDVVRLGLNGVPIPTNFGFDALEILPDGRFIASRAGPFSNEIYEINPVPDPVSGLAEVTLIPLDFPELNGTLNGLTVEGPRCVQAPAGLVSWWPGDTDASDIHDGNNGLLTNGALAGVPGKVDGAFRFDGVNDFVSIADADVFTPTSAGFTVEAWAKFDSFQTSGLQTRAYVVEKGPVSSTSGWEWFLGAFNFSGGAPTWQFGTAIPTGGIDSLAVSPESVLPDTWYHVAGTVDSSGVARLYVDGTLAATGSSAALPTNGTQPVKIGQGSGSGVQWFTDGLIDEVEIYNRALSTSEIQDIFNAGSAGKCKVTPNQPPVAQCQDVTVSADARCQANANVDNGSSDPDGDEIMLDQDPPGPYGLGDTNVTLTVTDDQGESDSCSSTVTVVDRESPAITCPAPQRVECTSPSGAVASFSQTFSDNCQLTVGSCAPPSGSSFSLGSTAVSCTATDESGNSSSCESSFEVVDTIPPAVACVESVNPSGKNVPRAKKVNEDGFYRVSASDVCASEPTITLDGIPLANGETIKITQRPRVSGVRWVNTMGPAQIKHFLVGRGDAVITATDPSGNTTSVICLVPPPPK